MASLQIPLVLLISLHYENRGLDVFPDGITCLRKVSLWSYMVKNGLISFFNTKPTLIMAAFFVLSRNNFFFFSLLDHNPLKVQEYSGVEIGIRKPIKMSFIFMAWISIEGGCTHTLLPLF